MKKLLLLCLLTISISTVASNIDYSQINPRFDEKSNAMILDVNAPCNQGGEPLYEFLWMTNNCDSTFIKERFKPDPYFFGEYYNDIEPSLPTSFNVTQSDMHLCLYDDEPYWIECSASWFDVTANMAFYACGEACEDGSISIGCLYVFKRIDGKWYFVGFAGAG